ncbi:hypothetical protein OTU49_010790 [Cherax quadricarinatus]|uniref:Uncharacterized protein n=1 Tax=Cherax quadricarinatus TaxID=27406 RepID=A0AAW0YFY9_CHEQU
MEESSNQHIYKYVNRQWKVLTNKGDDISIKDPKLKQGYIGDLSKASVLQLEEILLRQDQILRNKILISRLNDEGLSLKKRREEIAEALEAARAREKDLGESEALPDIHSLEWSGGMTTSSIEAAKKKVPLDSDDDDDDDKLDPLKLMAYHYSCVKKPSHDVQQSEEEDPADAIARELKHLDIQDTEREAQNKRKDFGSKRNDMLEKKYKRNGPVKDSFKPFKRSNNPFPLPDVIHHIQVASRMSTICIPQHESLKREREFLAKENARLLQETREKLKTIKRETIGLPPASSLLQYRDAKQNKDFFDSDEEQDEEESYPANDLHNYYENLHNLEEN